MYVVCVCGEREDTVISTRLTILLSCLPHTGEEGGAEERTPKRGISRSVKSQKVSLPSVLREVKARDHNALISGYLLSHAAKSRRWKKKWFVVYNLVLYEFEKHEVFLVIIENHNHSIVHISRIYIRKGSTS